MGDKVIVREEFLSADLACKISRRVGWALGLLGLDVVVISKVWTFCLGFSYVLPSAAFPILGATF